LALGVAAHTLVGDRGAGDGTKGHTPRAVLMATEAWRACLPDEASLDLTSPARPSGLRRYAIVLPEYWRP
jgi:hypothetical protein